MTADIAIIGAGIAGASLAAMVGDRARCLLIEAEAQPGYHATGRSAAFWSESYGGPRVQPLTTASHAWLHQGGFLHPRGCIHIGAADDMAALDSLAADMTAGGVTHGWLDRAGLEAALPGLRADYRIGLTEPTVRDIDVGGLHADFLGRARRAGATVLGDATVTGLTRAAGQWRIATQAGEVHAPVVVNAAGAWASAIAAMAGASPIRIRPHRRTVVQLAIDPAAAHDLPLIMDARGQFYFKPEAGGRLWLSPHDETPVEAHDVAAEEIDVAIAIERLEQAVDWRVLRRERAWAGLRSFAPDRLPVYGYDQSAPGFFWCAGQGGFGIQTAPAAAMLGAALLLDVEVPEAVAGVDAAIYSPRRFG